VTDTMRDTLRRLQASAAASAEEWRVVGRRCIEKAERAEAGGDLRGHHDHRKAAVIAFREARFCERLRQQARALGEGTDEGGTPEAAAVLQAGATIIRPHVERRE
jgi:hypothetical protein